MGKKNNDKILHSIEDIDINVRPEDIKIRANEYEKFVYNNQIEQFENASKDHLEKVLNRGESLIEKIQLDIDKLKQDILDQGIADEASAIFIILRDLENLVPEIKKRTDRAKEIITSSDKFLRELKPEEILYNLYEFEKIYSDFHHFDYSKSISLEELNEYLQKSFFAKEFLERIKTNQKTKKISLTAEEEVEFQDFSQSTEEFIIGVQSRINELNKKEEPVKQEEVKEEPVKQEEVKEEPVKQEEVKEEPVKQEELREEPSVENSENENPNDFRKILDSFINFDISQSTSLEELNEYLQKALDAKNYLDSLNKEIKSKKLKLEGVKNIKILFLSYKEIVDSFIKAIQKRISDLNIENSGDSKPVEQKQIEQEQIKPKFDNELDQKIHSFYAFNFVHCDSIEELKQFELLGRELIEEINKLDKKDKYNTENILEFIFAIDERIKDLETEISKPEIQEQKLTENKDKDVNDKQIKFKDKIKALFDKRFHKPKTDEEKRDRENICAMANKGIYGVFGSMFGVKAIGDWLGAGLAYGLDKISGGKINFGIGKRTDVYKYFEQKSIIKKDRIRAQEITENLSELASSNRDKFQELYNDIEYKTLVNKIEEYLDKYKKEKNENKKLQILEEIKNFRAKKLEMREEFISSKKIDVDNLRSAAKKYNEMINNARSSSYYDLPEKKRLEIEEKFNNNILSDKERTKYIISEHDQMTMRNRLNVLLLNNIEWKNNINKDRSKKIDYILRDYIAGTVNATALVKDALNTAMVFSGGIAGAGLRGAMYAIFATYGKLDKSALRYQKEYSWNKVGEKMKLHQYLGDAFKSMFLETYYGLSGKQYESGFGIENDKLKRYSDINKLEGSAKKIIMIRAWGELTMALGMGMQAFAAITTSGASIKNMLECFTKTFTQGNVLENMKDNFISYADIVSRLERTIKSLDDLRNSVSGEKAHVASANQVDDINEASQNVSPKESDMSDFQDIKTFNSQRIHEFANHGVPVAKGSSVSETLGINMPAGSKMTLVTFDRSGNPLIHENFDANFVAPGVKIVYRNGEIFAIDEHNSYNFYRQHADNSEYITNVIKPKTGRIYQEDVSEIVKPANATETTPVEDIIKPSYPEQIEELQSRNFQLNEDIISSKMSIYRLKDMLNDPNISDDIKKDIATELYETQKLLLEQQKTEEELYFQIEGFKDAQHSFDDARYLTPKAAESILTTDNIDVDQLEVENEILNSNSSVVEDEPIQINEMDNRFDYEYLQNNLRDVPDHVFTKVSIGDQEILVMKETAGGHQEFYADVNKDGVLEQITRDNNTLFNDNSEAETSQLNTRDSSRESAFNSFNELEQGLKVKEVFYDPNLSASQKLNFISEQMNDISNGKSVNFDGMVFTKNGGKIFYQLDSNHAIELTDQNFIRIMDWRYEAFSKIDLSNLNQVNVPDFKIIDDVQSAQKAMDSFLGNTTYTNKMEILRGLIDNEEQLNIGSAHFARQGNDIYYIIGQNRGVKLTPEIMNKVNQMLSNARERVLQDIADGK